MNHAVLIALKTVTTLWSFGMYLSPAPTVYRIHKAQATGEIQFVPFVAMFCNYHVWSLYSLFVGDLFPLFCAMAFAEVMGLIYTLIYIYHTQQRKQALKTVAIAAVPISLLTLYAVLAWTDVIPQSNAVTGKVLGYMGITTSCLFFASPLVKMRTVIRTRSAACIIAPLCITGGIGNALWIVTSAVAGDMFVLVPNSICLVLNSIQVFLTVKFNPSKIKCPVDDGLAISIEVPVKTGELDNPVYYALQSPANIQVSELRP